MSDSLLIRIYSFSFKNGHFGDPAGNGGGFVFDCRSLPNPGRNPDNMSLTGIDKPIIEELDSSSATQRFIEQSFAILKNAADSYIRRNFSDIMASFGCTGGRHRSVYCAERVAAALKNAGYNVRLIHWQMEKYDSRFFARRAMILAAGAGTRLKPLTGSKPKALVAAGGIPMLDWTIASLTKAGVNEIIVNAHHYRDDLELYILNRDHNSDKLWVSTSVEEKLLGTGGGIRKAARYLHGPSPVMVHNVDVWTDFDLAEIYGNHYP
nr:NTP transferase domain-containing protein [FCB group bacterium]